MEKTRVTLVTRLSLSSLDVDWLPCSRTLPCSIEPAVLRQAKTDVPPRTQGLGVSSRCVRVLYPTLKVRSCSCSNLSFWRCTGEPASTGILRFTNFGKYVYVLDSIRKRAYTDLFALSWNPPQLRRRSSTNKHAQIAELILLRLCVRRTVLSTEKVSISFGALLPDSPQSGRCPTQESYVPGCLLRSWEPAVIVSVVQEGNFSP